MIEYIEYILMKIPGRLGRSLRYRYYKSQFKKCGKNVDIWDNVVIYGTKGIEVGNDVAFGRNSVINGGGGLKLGSYILMGPCCFIWTVNHDYNVKNMWNIRKEIKKPVIIGDNVWISANVKIIPGVEIGTGSVLGLGAVVTKDVPPYCVMGGNPATILKRIKKGVRR